VGRIQKPKEMKIEGGEFGKRKATSGKREQEKVMGGVNMIK
jgi:hypothetical protein